MIIVSRLINAVDDATATNLIVECDANQIHRRKLIRQCNGAHTQACVIIYDTEHGSSAMFSRDFTLYESECVN